MLDPDVALAKGMSEGMNVEVELAHVTLSNIQECITVLIPAFSEIGESSLEICNQGGDLLDLIDGAREGLGKVNVSTIKGKKLEEELKKFTDKASAFDFDKNDGKMKSFVKMMMKNSETFCSSLRRPWNSDIQAIPESESETVVIEEGDWKFEICSPLKGTKVHVCPKCSKQFRNASHFEKHYKECDGAGGSGLNVDSEFKVDHPRVTCRLPHKSGKTTSVRWDQFGRHLKNVHGTERPDDQFPRGFLSKDGGKTYEIVFRKKGDPDPQPPSRSQGRRVETEENKERQSQQEMNDSQPQVSDANVNPKIATIIVEKTEAARNLVATGLVDEALDKVVNEFARDVVPQEKTPNTLSPEFHGYAANSVPKRKIIVESDGEDYDLSHPIAAKKRNDVEPEPEKHSNSQTEEFSQDQVNLNQDDQSYVQDEFCRSFEEHQEALEQEFQKFNFTVDSDIEDNDSESFTQTRIKNKKQRYAERNVPRPIFNLSQLPGNAEVLEDMLGILLAESTSTNEKNAILTDSKNLLFVHKDSFLHYMVARVPEFKMKNLIDFNGDNFVPLPDPSEWVNSIGGSSGQEQAGRRKSMLKTYKRLIHYVSKKIGTSVWGTDTMSIVRKNQLRQDLKHLNDEVDSSKMMNQLNSIIENERVERRLAKEVLNPNQSFNEANGNKIYFSSAKYLSREERMDQHFKDAMKAKKISDSQFTEISSFTRSILAFTDRNRSGVFNFSNGDYLNKTPLWFPVDHNRTEFDGIPQESIKNQPADGRAPDLYMIQLSGKGPGIKLQRPVTITIIPRVEAWMSKLRLLKDLFFGTFVLTDPFFQSSSGKILGKMTNTRGSMLNEYGEVTGIDFVSQNVIRRSLEPHVQSNAQLKARNVSVVNHSVSVSQQYYDSSDALFRSAALHYVNQQEMPTSQTQSQDKEEDEVDTEISVKRARLEKSDAEAKMKKAQSVLKKPVNKNLSVGPRCKITPENRLWIQKAFSKGGKFEAELRHYKKFPGPKKFRAVFYRKLDSMPSADEESKKLHDIEMETFSGIKSKACEEEDWDGSMQSNKKADDLVAAAIHQSLKSYEKNRKSYDEEFFNFG